VLRGNHAARIDDKGRLKIPNAFRALIEERHGTELFVTSLTGEYVRIFPMPVWLELEKRVAEAPAHPSLLKFLDRVNYYGQAAEIDGQGRVLIHPRLRQSAGMSGDVDVFGHFKYLEVWNHERFEAKLNREPFTDEDLRAIAALGI
jgi:MraZ protein